jgi:hypothetical protein
MVHHFGIRERHSASRHAQIVSRLFAFYSLCADVIGAARFSPMLFSTISVFLDPDQRVRAADISAHISDEFYSERHSGLSLEA